MGPLGQLQYSPQEAAERRLGAGDTLPFGKPALANRSIRATPTAAANVGSSFVQRCPVMQYRLDIPSSVRAGCEFQGFS